MKIVNPMFDCVFEFADTEVNTVVIENQRMFSDFCKDIYVQLEGWEGNTVLSENDIPLAVSKNVEMLSQFIPFEINRKHLVNKLVASAEKLANEPEYYEYTMREIANIEKYLWNITENMVGNITFSKLSIGNIIKSVGMEFEDDYSNLCEKIIDYMELVREYDKDKLFIMINLRSYIDDEETQAFMDTILRKQFKVLLVDNCEYGFCKHEKRVIIDKDMCGFAMYIDN